MNVPVIPRLSLALLAVTTSGCTLSIATVSAPDINCRFDHDCTITVEDSVGAIPVPFGSGEGRLQSRTQPPGEAGTPGAGLFAYEYRVDLTPVGGLTAQICVNKLSLDFGPIERLDYDRDGDLDHVYVVTGGGLGSVAPSSARRSGDRVTFSFSPGVCPGNAPGNGETSYFFGLASQDPAQPVTATVSFSDGTTAAVAARAPN
jgi:hypothetical protein